MLNADAIKTAIVMLLVLAAALAAIYTDTGEAVAACQNAGHMLDVCQATINP